MQSSTPYLRVIYRITADNGRAASELARKIVVEQTVETPESLITAEIERRYLGIINEITPVSGQPEQFDVQVEYGAESVGGHLAQLVNLVWGNVSMYQGVSLQDMNLSSACAAQWVGPRFGIEGIRDLLGVYNRPLLSTALKPRGRSNDEFAAMAYEFALGGGDIVKDDQNLTGDFDDFRDRTAKCSAAVARANQESGFQCLYFPYIAAPFEQLEAYFSWVKQLGIRGVLLCPMIMGLDAVRALTQRYDLILMAHPAFSGGFAGMSANSMQPHLLYGTLYRLAGVDISIFVHPNTRFPTKREDSLAIAQRAREPLANLRGMFPCPAGGLQRSQLSSVFDDYGVDTVLLVGGSLLTAHTSLREATKNYLQTIAERFPDGHRSSSVSAGTGVCELESEIIRSRVRTILKQNDFRWTHRPVSEYKNAQQADFRAVSRTELIGKAGEQTSFELRYFEVGAEGFTSLERHAHTHVIIGVRGTGSLRMNGETHTLGPMDIAYIPPNAVHQLLNHGKIPFGFFCLVDRQRDRPVAIDQ